MRPDVGHHAWREQRVACAQGDRLVADLERELSFDDVEPLVLLVVEVPRWSALAHVDVLKEEQRAVAVLARDLDLEREVP